MHIICWIFFLLCQGTLLLTHQVKEDYLLNVTIWSQIIIMAGLSKTVHSYCWPPWEALYYNNRSRGYNLNLNFTLFRAPPPVVKNRSIHHILAPLLVV